MPNGKNMMIRLIVGLIKKTLRKMNQYFPKRYRAFGRNINVKVDLSNYVIKADLKNATGIDTSNFALQSNFSVDLSKLSNVVNNDVVKKTMYDKLVRNIKNIDTSGFVLKAKYNKNKSD